LELISSDQDFDVRLRSVGLKFVFVPK